MAEPIPRTFSDSETHLASTEAIARETHTPRAEVAKLYDEEFTTLAADAKITQFLGVLTSRRVRLRLRKH